MVYICAQTRHGLSATEVVEWLKNSDYGLHVLGLQVYGYWVEGRHGEMEEGYWWVAEVNEISSWIGKARTKGGLRVYENSVGSYGIHYKGRYFTVKELRGWPVVERFRVALEGDDSNVPMLGSSVGRKVDFPYTYHDMYVTVREKKPKRRVPIAVEALVSEAKNVYTKDLEGLDRLEELLTEALAEVKRVRTLVI